MYKKKRILALIPARLGSKGLKKKNIKNFINKPLFLWPAKAALKSKYIDKVVVSSDSKKIVNLSKKNNIESPFLRPKNLSTDNAKSIDVIIHAIKFYENRKEFFDYLILLEPTSPLTDNKDIDNAIKEMINNTRADTLVSIYPAINNHPNYLFKKNKNNFLKNNILTSKFTRRQDLDKVYYLDGSLYIGKIKHLKKYKTFTGKKTLGFTMDKIKSFEIDDKVDLSIVQLLYKKYYEE
jgi:N-acylneuraminate cytidylyltransferase/CMP-N,N'-diacetyllegionaminic acid synthase